MLGLKNELLDCPSIVFFFTAALSGGYFGSWNVLYREFCSCEGVAERWLLKLL